MSNFFKRIFHYSNKIRVVILNFIFWVILLLGIYYGTQGVDDFPKGETLLIQPGIISDTVGEEELLTIFMSGADELPSYTLTADIVFALESAAFDKDIENVILDLDALISVGYASSEEIGYALDMFKNSGKKVYAYASFYSQEQYYLASFADEISMDPYGELSIDGLGVYRNYWKNLLDRYHIDVNIFRAGDYKSYVEPYISDSMSAEVKSQNLKWMNSVWDGFISDIELNRNINPLTLNNYFSDRVSLLKKYDGDSAIFSSEVGFVDFLETRDKFFDKFYEFYNLEDYISEKSTSLTSGTKVGVLNIEGAITYADNNPGSVSALDIEAVLDNFMYDDYSGLIVRINSGGGGVYASEIIRRKVEEVAEYMPVVISMGDVCASGGYWIATAGNMILTNNRTITGSIGVFGMMFGLENTLDKQLGVKSDGVSTTPYAEQFSYTRNISQESAEIFQLGVDNTYKKFLNLVSESREIELSKLESIAGGRVWSGEQALEFGLADYEGGLTEAKGLFFEDLETDDIEFVTLEGEFSIFEQIYSEISNIKALPQLSVLEEVELFDRIKDPKNIYAFWY